MERDLLNEAYEMSSKVNYLFYSAFLKGKPEYYIVMQTINLIDYAKMEKTLTPKEKEAMIKVFDKKKYKINKFIKDAYESINNRQTYCESCQRFNRTEHKNKNLNLQEMHRDIVPDRHELLFESM